MSRVWGVSTRGSCRGAVPLLLLLLMVSLTVRCTFSLRLCSQQSPQPQGELPVQCPMFTFHTARCLYQLAIADARITHRTNCSVSSHCNGIPNQLPSVEQLAFSCCVLVSLKLWLCISKELSILFRRGWWFSEGGGGCV